MSTAYMVSEGLSARYGGDFRSLLKRHHVPCAGERDLRRLGEFLFTNAAFRSDLFALCNSISHMAQEDLTPEELLGLVAESYGPGLAAPVEVRAEFAAAYQGWNARELALELPERGGAEHSSGQMRAAQAMPATSELADVDETLQRLSFSSLELKMFLADVKQRVREMDPELEHLERMVEQMKSATSKGVAGGSRVMPVAAAPAAVLQDAATVRRLRVGVGALAAALVLAVGCGAWLARGYFDAKTALVRIEERAAGQTTAATRAVAPVITKPTAAVAGVRAPAMVPRAKAPALRATAAMGGERDTEANAPVHIAAPIVRVDPDARARSAGPMFVPSSTMIGYALATPKPVYPAVSVPDDKAGRVEVQATISPEGEVVATHVLSGPVVFREAADQAMKGWRFRPYLVDGKPVEVSTTVAFVFRSMPAT